MMMMLKWPAQYIATKPSAIRTQNAKMHGAKIAQTASVPGKPKGEILHVQIGVLIRAIAGRSIYVSQKHALIFVLMMRKLSSITELKTWVAKALSVSGDHRTLLQTKLVMFSNLSRCSRLH